LAGKAAVKLKIKNENANAKAKPVPGRFRNLKLISRKKLYAFVLKLIEFIDRQKMTAPIFEF